ncbi:MAG: hypothetical protein KC486_33035, partial [Myxococcales bacterium]|nr:hypothetical protein [Myxococcales bacterium]
STSEPGTTTTTTSTTSGGDFDCSQNACLKCHQLDGEGGGLPFPICKNLRWDCDFPSPCGELALAFIEPGVYEAVDVDAAVCAIEAMMGGQPAKIALSQISDPGAAIFVVGDGTAMIQWDTYGGDIVYAARSGRLTLQDASYFTACLADPTPANLGACLFGGNTLCAPEGSWTPPWSTGECSSAIPEGCAKG